MSLLFNLIAKLLVKEGDEARFVSYPLETPYMLVDYRFEEGESSNGEENVFISYWLFNPRNEKIMEITGKKVPKVLLSENCHLLGTSRGWAAFLSFSEYTIHLSQILNPWSSSESSHKTIALPPFPDHLSPHFDMVINVSLSTPFPDRDKDYIVSVTFFGSKLSYCMPNSDSEWTTINIPFCNNIDSHVLYSQKDQAFYLLTTGCAYMVCLDLKNNKNPSFMKLQFEKFPLIPQQEWEVLASCLRSDYIAESSCGKRFIVQWYVETRRLSSNDARINEKTKRFMVFEIEDEVKHQRGRVIATYTENIGDLCIFIGENELFCLESSKFSGLKPNSIYYVSYGFGIYDINTRRSREYSPSGFPMTRGHAMFLSPDLC